MEYYGKGKALRLVAAYDADDIYDQTTQIGFINAKGMLMEYATKHYTEGKVFYRKGKCTGECTPAECETSHYDERYKDLEKIKYKGKTYYVGFARMSIYEKYVIYIEAPAFENDDTFRWKENKRYGTKEATIVTPNFEYFCVQKGDGNAFVEVRYTKCDNRHRNKVTIARIDVYNASNGAILDAIVAWKKEMKQELAA